MNDLEVPLEHTTRLLLRLASCPPNQGLVIGSPGNAALAAFNTCHGLGLIESVSFYAVTVWKLTALGRAYTHGTIFGVGHLEVTA